MINGRRVEYRLVLDSLKYVEEVTVDGRRVLYHRGDSSGYALMKESYHVTGGSPGAYFGKDYYHTALSSLLSEAPTKLFKLAEILRGITVHSLVPESIRLRAPITASPEPGYRGENLACFLLHLYLEDRASFRIIEDALRALVPEEVIPHIEGTEVEVWIRAKGLREPLKPHQGFIKALCGKLGVHNKVLQMRGDRWRKARRLISSIARRSECVRAIVLKDTHGLGEEFLGEF